MSAQNSNQVVWVSIKRACEILDLSEVWVRRQCEQGKLVSKKEGKRRWVAMESIQAKKARMQGEIHEEELIETVDTDRNPFI